MAPVWLALSSRAVLLWLSVEYQFQSIKNEHKVTYFEQSLMRCLQSKVKKCRQIIGFNWSAMDFSEQIGESQKTKKLTNAYQEQWKETRFECLSNHVFAEFELNDCGSQMILQSRSFWKLTFNLWLVARLHHHIEGSVERVGQNWKHKTHSRSSSVTVKSV